MTEGGCYESHFDGQGTPPSYRPAGFTAAKEAILFSLASDGTVHKLLAAPGDLRVEELTLAAPGPQYYFALMTRMYQDRLGALWCQKDSSESPTTQVTFAVLDEKLAAQGPLNQLEVPGKYYPYALRMDVTFCEGRFVGVWFDDIGGAVWQMAPDGGLVGDLIRFGKKISGGKVRVLCLEGGVVILSYDGISTLRCPGS